ncbi:GNAT family N-acetyltransferase [Candidatus Bathyarchaeota archaeon]|nr:GNAT family N-acetyltransferase [Candidatus Bathyarchaeota archaeon]
MNTRTRKVSTSDRNDILEISRHIWDGHDYLPLVIDEWLSDQNSYTYGIEADDHLVALANLRLIENGQTGWMEGLRVHPDYRGKGFAHILTKDLIKRARNLGVKRLRHTTSTENCASLRLAEKYGFVKILEKNVFGYPIPKDMLPSIGHLGVRKSNPREVYAMLQQNPKIIPHNILFFDWKAFDCTLEALETLGKTHEFYVATQKGKIDSLSYAYSGLAQRRPFTIYASDTRGFLLHLSHNIALASKHGLEWVAGTCDIDFEKVLNEVEWIPEEERWSTHMALLEKKLFKS